MTNRIKEWRLRRSWSLHQLAERAHTTKSQIDKLEKGQRRLTVDWMVRLAKALGCDPRELMAAPAQAPALPQDLIPVRSLPHTKHAKMHYVPRPYFLSDASAAYALPLSDTSLQPRYAPGQLLFVHPNRKPRMGQAVVVIGMDGRILLRLYAGTKGQAILLLGSKPKTKQKIAKSEIASMHLIIGCCEL